MRSAQGTESAQYDSQESSSSESSSKPRPMPSTSRPVSSMVSGDRGSPVSSWMDLVGSIIMGLVSLVPGFVNRAKDGAQVNHAKANQPYRLGCLNQLFKNVVGVAIYICPVAPRMERHAKRLTFFSPNWPVAGNRSPVDALDFMVVMVVYLVSSIFLRLQRYRHVLMISRADFTPRNPQTVPIGKSHQSVSTKSALD